MSFDRRRLNSRASGLLRACFLSKKSPHMSSAFLVADPPTPSNSIGPTIPVAGPVAATFFRTGSTVQTAESAPSKPSKSRNSSGFVPKLPKRYGLVALRRGHFFLDPTRQERTPSPNQPDPVRMNDRRVHSVNARCWHPNAEPVQNPQGWQVPRRARDYSAAPAGLWSNRRANRAPYGRTVFLGSAPRGAATPPSLCGQPYGLADSRFEPIERRLHCGGSDGPTSFRPVLFGSKRESA